MERFTDLPVIVVFKHFVNCVHFTSNDEAKYPVITDDRWRNPPPHFSAISTSLLKPFMHTESQPITAFVCAFGTFLFERMPFGLINAGNWVLITIESWLQLSLDCNWVLNAIDSWSIDFDCNLVRLQLSPDCNCYWLQLIWMQLSEIAIVFDCNCVCLQLSLIAIVIIAVERAPK